MAHEIHDPIAQALTSIIQLAVETIAITLVEYGDFACTNCGEAHSVLKRFRRGN